MSKDDKKKRKKLPIDYMPHISNVASANECTGLVPEQPQTEEELESYESLYSMSIPVDDDGKF